MKKTQLWVLISVLITRFLLAQSGIEYNPMNVGNYWIQHIDSIKGEYRPSTFRMDVECIELIGDQEFFRIKQEQRTDDGSRAPSSWYIWTGWDSTGGLIGAFGNGVGIDSAYIYEPPLLSHPVEATTLGYTWEYDFPGTGMGVQHWSCTLESFSETVEVPAGVYHNCMEMNIIITDTLGDTTQTTNYYYAENVGQVLNEGWSFWAGDYRYELIEYHIVAPVNLTYSAESPDEYYLIQNYPNPFNPITTIQYSLPEAGSVNLNIFNIQGQAVMTLQDVAKPPGTYEVQWNGTDRSGNPVSTGVYFARLQVEDPATSTFGGVPGGAIKFSQTIKMVYLR